MTKNQIALADSGVSRMIERLQAQDRAADRAALDEPVGCARR
jgi:hypothetical protein